MFTFAIALTREPRAFREFLTAKKIISFYKKCANSMLAKIPSEQIIKNVGGRGEEKIPGEDRLIIKSVSTQIC